MTREEAIIQLRLGPGINEDVSEKYNDAVNIAIEALQQEPKRGKWLNYLKEGLKWKCSECGSRFTTLWDYCPHCGADMRGEDE